LLTTPLGIYTAPLEMSDLFLGTLVLIIIIILGNSRKSKFAEIEGNGHYKYYMLNIYFKLFFALSFGAIYMFYYQGGDTMAYWQGAEKLNNLMWSSPGDYLTEMMNTPSQETIILRFNPKTGYPPGWIYRDPNSFFVSKILSVFMIFLGQSYVVLTMVLGYITAIGSWKIFEIVRSYKITSDWFAAVSILFIPSVSFWCSGVSKDTIVLLSVFFMLHHSFSLFNKTAPNRFRSMILICIFGITLYHTRSFMLFTVGAPMILAISTRVLKRYRESPFLLNSARFVLLLVGFAGLLLFLRISGDQFAKTSDAYLTEAAVTQDDFTNNKSYGEKKYDLGITDYSPFGMLRVAPMAILTAFYRPAIWEANSPFLLLSSLESIVFMYLTFIFLFKGKLGPKIRRIQSNEFLMFGLLFAFILAFFAGFTSVLFGVLVRFKAPLLPFLLIIFTTQTKENAMSEDDSKPVIE
jgi:hypothetical protein